MPADTERVRAEILETRLRLAGAEQRRHTRERTERVRSDKGSRKPADAGQTGRLTRFHLDTDPGRLAHQLG